MALATTVLAQELKAAADKASLNNGLSATARRDTYNEEVAAAHEKFIKSGLVSVVTTGSATTQSGTGNIT